MKYLEKLEDDSEFRFPQHNFETGLSRNERFIINKINSDYLDKLHKELENGSSKANT